MEPVTDTLFSYYKVHYCLVFFTLLVCCPSLFPRFAVALTAMPYLKQRGSGTALLIISGTLGMSSPPAAIARTPCRDLDCVWMMVKKSTSYDIKPRKPCGGASQAVGRV